MEYQTFSDLGRDARRPYFIPVGRDRDVDRMPARLAKSLP
jgi:hypothetical protein